MNVVKPDDFHFSFRHCFQITKSSLSCRDMNRFTSPPTPVAHTQKECFFVALSTRMSKIPRKEILSFEEKEQYIHTYIHLTALAQSSLGCWDMDRFLSPPMPVAHNQKAWFFLSPFQLRCPKSLGRRYLTAPGLWLRQTNFIFLSIAALGLQKAPRLPEYEPFLDPTPQMEWKSDHFKI